jgi:sporulation protein YlmC with PRC-barrel domain
MRFSPQMRDVLIGLALTVLLLGAVPVARAEDPGKVDLEALEMVSELIGAPVFSKDGTEVGQVADIAFDDKLQPQRLRMTTGRHLGLGARTLEIPKGSFMPVRGAVILDVPAEAVAAFAELAPPSADK